MKLVLIEWEDSLGCSPKWQSLEGAEPPKPLLCQSVGWLFHDGKDCKVVVRHVTKDHAGASRQGCGDMTIPTKAIISIKRLRG